jgi:hypothetical protein
MYVEVELFTADHVIRGFLDSPGERLSDILNIKTQTSLFLTDVEMSPLISVGRTAPSKFSQAMIEKSTVLFAIPVVQDITHKSIYRRAVRRNFVVHLAMPSFVLEGTIHLTESLDIKKVFVTRPEDFIPITEARAIYTLNPKIDLRSNTIVFNKHNVQLLGERFADEPPTAPRE